MATNSTAPPAFPPQLYGSEQPRVVGVMSAMLALSMISLAFRFLARGIQKVRFGVDDFFAIFAAVNVIGEFVCCILLVQAGVGRHTPIVVTEDPDSIRKFFLYLFASIWPYSTALATVKLSILFMYRRLFTVASFRKYIYLVCFIVVAWWFGINFAALFSCKPIYGYWDKTVNPQCEDLKTFVIANSVPNMITDAIILALPMKYVWQLKITMVQKVSLTFIFLLGGLIIAFSAVRMKTLLVVDDEDFFWVDADTVIWTFNEVSLALICANLPTMQPLLRSWYPKQFLTRVRTFRRSTMNGKDTQTSSLPLSVRSPTNTKGFQSLVDDSDDWGTGNELGQVSNGGIVKTTTVNFDREPRI